MTGPMSTFASKGTAFVTGASYGVGAATALALAQAGLTVAISATRAENLESILRSVEATGAQALPIVLDLRSQSSIAETLKHIAGRLGPIDLLVNNAAGNLRKPALDVTWEEWDRAHGDQPARGVLSVATRCAPMHRRRSPRRNRQHRFGARAPRRGRAVRVWHIEGGAHPDDAHARSRMGRAWHSRQRGRAGSA